MTQITPGGAQLAVYRHFGTITNMTGLIIFAKKRESTT